MINTKAILQTKTDKDIDGLVIELFCSIDFSDDDLEKLKLFREEFGKSSPLHFHFDNNNYIFSQKKYYKKKQYVKEPPKLSDIEKEFMSDVKETLRRFKNFIDFEKLENLNKTVSIELS